MIHGKVHAGKILVYSASCTCGFKSRASHVSRPSQLSTSTGVLSPGEARPLHYQVKRRDVFAGHALRM